ncbi:efflux RND transporter periplasmic adaptor subunit [Haploplasma axanthum]|uniref:Efflux transporter, RND family, MFP subunit n=1 Tax=Haploplasma axanthum TaxID=29552 RepID=A0A449BFG8_HAPAX|nr:HlyD family efflux transporter periplasmic adaptor subunit [Haploplasma axanthum]VEU81181.1 efflux transporter, RND family, MFP subunit [Haploplasma axanthum]
MKKGYIISIIVLLSLMLILQLIPLIFKKDEKDFKLPELEDNISTYDELTTIIRTNFTDDIELIGNIIPYKTEKIFVEDHNLSINDYLYGEDELLIINNLEGIYKVISIQKKDNVFEIEIVSLTDLKIEFYIKQENVDDLKIGKELTYSFNEKMYHSIIENIEPEIKNGLIRVQANIDENNKNILSGSIVNVKINKRTKANVLLVNKRAVYYLNGVAYVDIVKKTENREIIERTSVVLGLQNKVFFEVLNGLTEGQRAAIYYNGILE